MSNGISKFLSERTSVSNGILRFHKKISSLFFKNTPKFFKMFENFLCNFWKKLELIKQDSVKELVCQMKFWNFTKKISNLFFKNTPKIKNKFENFLWNFWKKLEF